MNEAEWLACSDPTLMLALLRSKAGERKLRLFICACARRVVWHPQAAAGNAHLREQHRRTVEASQLAVEVAERFADGLAAQEERQAARGGRGVGRKLE
jgi:hypothetical protein